MQIPLRHTVTTSPLGDILLVAEDDKLVGVYFYDVQPDTELGIWVSPADPTLERVATQLDQYFRGTRQYFDIDYTMRGEAFALAVWDATAAIGYGETKTYGEIAKAIGKPHAARAVGGALNRNPLSLIVPCHRVVKTDGGLSGYAGGVGRKAALLELESIIDMAEGDRLF